MKTPVFMNDSANRSESVGMKKKCNVGLVVFALPIILNALVS
jgi:hypothetical protein